MVYKSQRTGRKKYFNVARKNWGHERRSDEQRREMVMEKEIKIKEK
jgi:hypothetical protein